MERYQNNKTRVLVIVNGTSGGGVERVADAHIRLLHDCEQFDVAAATCDEPPPYLASDRHFRFLDFRNSPVTKVMGTLGLGVNKSAMEACLQAFRPDIVHIHAYIQFSPSALAALLAYKKKHRCTIFLTHHTFAFVCPNDALYNYRLGMLCEKCIHGSRRHILADRCYGSTLASWGKYLQKSGFKRIFDKELIDVHIVPSEFLRGMLLKHDPSLTVHMVMNPCIEEVSQAMPAKKQGKLVYFGRISREKNVLAAVRAIMNLSCDIQFTIIGDGPLAGALHSFLDTHKSASGIGRITFINKFLPVNQLYPLVKDAQYFILPSVCYETAGVSIVEALNFGMTPIVSGWGSMKELINYAGVGYTFDPRNHASIEKAILEAVTHREEDENTLTGPVKKKLEAFTFSAYARSILDLYASVSSSSVRLQAPLEEK